MTITSRTSHNAESSLARNPTTVTSRVPQHNSVSVGTSTQQHRTQGASTSSRPPSEAFTIPATTYNMHLVQQRPAIARTPSQPVIVDWRSETTHGPQETLANREASMQRTRTNRDSNRRGRGNRGRRGRGHRGLQAESSRSSNRGNAPSRHVENRTGPAINNGPMQHTAEASQRQFLALVMPFQVRLIAVMLLSFSDPFIVTR
jgi:hypothetical protein